MDLDYLTYTELKCLLQYANKHKEEAEKDINDILFRIDKISSCFKGTCAYCGKYLQEKKPTMKIFCNSSCSESYHQNLS